MRGGAGEIRKTCFRLLVKNAIGPARQLVAFRPGRCVNQRTGIADDPIVKTTKEVELSVANVIAAGRSPSNAFQQEPRCVAHLPQHQQGTDANSLPNRKVG